MKKIRVAFSHSLILFLLSLLFSFSIYGQGYKSFKLEQKEIVRRSKWRLGPFRISPLIQLKDIGYDDNVYYQHGEDDPASDFTGTFSPVVKVHVLFPSFLILSLTENPEFVYYHEQKRERRWNNSISPEIKLLLFNRFVLTGTYSKSSRRRRASSEFDVRANEILENYVGKLFYETGWRTSFGISASSTRISYEDITIHQGDIDLSLALNREERNGSFEFYYRILSKSYIIFRAAYTEYRFVYPESKWRDSESYQVHGGIQFPLLGKVRGKLSLGYKKLTPRVGDKKGFSGLVGDTGLDFRLKSFGFRLNYKRDCHFSYWTNNIFFNEDRYGAGISLYLTRFLRIDYSLSYGEAFYPEATALPTPDGGTEEMKRKDIYRAQVVGFVFRIVKNTGLGVMLNFWERDSNYYAESRKRMFVGGYITYDF